MGFRGALLLSYLTGVGQIRAKERRNRPVRCRSCVSDDNTPILGLCGVLLAWLYRVCALVVFQRVWARGGELVQSQDQAWSGA